MEDRSRHTFDTWPTDLLIDYAIKIHHRGIRTRGPLTLELLGRVKAERPLVLSQVEQLFAASLEALDAHLFKEENVLFPYIEELHEFALDLQEHTHIENDLIFPQAVEMEGKWVNGGNGSHCCG